MDTPNDAAMLRLEISEDELLSVEYSLPRIENDLTEQADAERQRYDEQILAALVAPSF